MTFLNGQTARKSYNTVVSICRFVFANAECPRMIPILHNEQFRNFFNWTMTYRADADVGYQYGQFVPRAGSSVPSRFEHEYPNSTE